MALHIRPTANWNAWLLILTLSMIILCTNFPIFIHPRSGMDNFFYIYLSNEIVNQHTIPWLLHPASIFGLYPFSTPSSFPLLLAEYKSLSGIDNDTLVIIIGDILFWFGGIISFLISLKITRNTLYSFIVALILIMSPYFFNWLWNTTTSRILLLDMVLYIVLIYFLFKRKERSHLQSYFLYITFLLFIIFLFTIHRTAILFFGGFLIFLYFKMISHLSKKINPLIFKLFTLATVSFAFLFPFLNNLGIKGYSGLIYRNGVFKSEHPLFLIINFIISMVGGVGIIGSLMIVMGVAYLLVLERHGYSHDILLLALGFLTSLLLMSPSYLYVRGSLPIVAVLFSVYLGDKIKIDKKLQSIWRDKVNKKYSIFRLIITFILIFILIINNFGMQNYWLSKPPQKLIEEIESPYAPQYSYESGLYLKYMAHDDRIVVDSFVDARWLQYFGGVEILPSALGFNNEMNYVLFYSRNISVRPLTWENIKSNPDGIIGIDYLWTSPQISEIRRDYIHLMSGDIHSDTSKKILDKYEVKYALNNVNYKTIYFFWDRPRNSSFYTSLNKYSYTIFINSGHVIWYISY